MEFSEAGDPASPRLRRVLLAFILVASYEVLGEGEEMPVESLIFRLSMRYWLSRQAAALSMTGGWILDAGFLSFQFLVSSSLAL